MKKTLLLSVIAFFAINTFADDITTTTILDFENGVDSTYAQYVGMVPWINAAIDVSVDTVVTNPNKNGINETGQCWMVTEAGGGWWSNFWNVRIADIAVSNENAYHEGGMTHGLDEPGSITITEANRYLHVMHYRSALTLGFSLNINTSKNHGNDAAGTFRWDTNNSEAGVWEDHVFDLKTLMDNGVSFCGFSVIVNRSWGGTPNPDEATSYGFDEIVLSSSAIPRGATILSGADKLLNASDTTKINSYIFQKSPTYDQTTVEFVANPFTNDIINAGGDVVKITKADSVTWWKAFNCDFDGMYLIEPGVTQYLHVLFKADVTMDFQISVRDISNKEYTQIETYDSEALTEYGFGFFDYVMDLSEMQGITSLAIRPNLQKDTADAYINTLPGSVVYIDEIVIDDNPDVRMDPITSGTAIRTIENSNVKVSVNNMQLSIMGEDLLSAELFTISGVKVQSQDLVYNKTIDIAKQGIYIVKVNTTQGTLIRKVAIR